MLPNHRGRHLGGGGGMNLEYEGKIMVSTPAGNDSTTDEIPKVNSLPDIGVFGQDYTLANLTESRGKGHGVT